MRDDGHLYWKELSRKRVTSHSLFDLYLSERSSTGGARGEFLILDAPDWVNVVAVVPAISGEERFLMVRQYRHGLDAVTTEFPAGLVEREEDPQAAAVRELREETGYQAGRMTFLGKVSPNPAFMRNWCYTYLAEELHKVGDKALDDLEQLEVVEVSLRTVEEKLGSGEYTNSLAMVAYFWYIRARDEGTV